MQRRLSPIISRIDFRARFDQGYADLILGSNSQLQALAEVYGSDDPVPQFVNDFLAAWDNVMNLDRFDVA